MVKIAKRNAIIYRDSKENKANQTEQKTIGNTQCYTATIKCEVLLSFLMGCGETNKISDSISGIGPGEMELSDFFNKFEKFRIKRKGKDFAHKFSEKTLQLIHNPVKDVPIDYYHRTLFEGYYYGFVDLFVIFERNEEGVYALMFKFLWASFIHKIKIPAMFEEFKQERGNRRIFTTEEKSKLKNALTINFMKQSVLPTVVRRTNTSINEIDNNQYNEATVRDKMKQHFKDVIKEKIMSVCKYTDSTRLDNFINVKHECSFNKLTPELQKRETARLDLAIRLVSGNDPEHRLRVVIELKKDWGLIKDHTIMKENSKNYDTLDLLYNEKNIIYFSASMNSSDVSKLFDGKAHLSHFISERLDDKK